MPMIGARFYSQLDATHLRNDVLEHALSRVSSTVCDCDFVAMWTDKSIVSASETDWEGADVNVRNFLHCSQLLIMM